MALEKFVSSAMLYKCEIYMTKNIPLGSEIIIVTSERAFNYLFIKVHVEIITIVIELLLKKKDFSIAHRLSQVLDKRKIFIRG